MKNGIQLVETIDFLLKIKKQSRRDFCKSINIPPSTIATWKSRNIYPTVDILSDIAFNLGVSLDWLVNGEDNEVFVIRRTKDFSELSMKYFNELLQLEKLSSEDFYIIKSLLNKLSKN